MDKENVIDINILIQAYDDIQRIKEVCQSPILDSERIEQIAKIVGLSLNYKRDLGRWAVFTKEGMTPVLHGKIVDVMECGCYIIKCKNGVKRYIPYCDIIKICDIKSECYSTRG